MGVNFGSATPSDFKLGSNAVSAIHLGSNQVWPTGGGVASWSGQSAPWLLYFPAVGTYGLGTVSSKFSRSAFPAAPASNDSFDYASLVVPGAGTVKFYCSMNTDNDALKINRVRAGTSTTMLSISGDGNGTSGTFGTSVASPASFAVQANDTITFGSRDGNDYLYASFFTMWWE